MAPPHVTTARFNLAVPVMGQASARLALQSPVRPTPSVPAIPARPPVPMMTAALPAHSAIRMVTAQETAPMAHHVATTVSANRAYARRESAAIRPATTPVQLVTCQARSASARPGVMETPVRRAVARCVVPARARSAAPVQTVRLRPHSARMAHVIPAGPTPERALAGRAATGRAGRAWPTAPRVRRCAIPREITSAFLAARAARIVPIAGPSSTFASITCAAHVMQCRTSLGSQLRTPSFPPKPVKRSISAPEHTVALPGPLAISSLAVLSPSLARGTGLAAPHFPVAYGLHQAARPCVDCRFREQPRGSHLRAAGSR